MCGKLVILLDKQLFFLKPKENEILFQEIKLIEFKDSLCENMINYF